MLQFSLQRSFFRFIPRYLRFFSATLNGSDITSSFLAVELFAYTKGISLSPLILHPAALLNSPMSFYGFFVESFGSPVYRIMSMNRDNLDFSFPVCIPLIYLAYLIPLARISSAILNISCIWVLDLSRKCPAFPYSVFCWCWDSHILL